MSEWGLNMPNQLLQNTVVKFGDEARQDLFEGATILYQAVSTTLSPAGRNVAIGSPSPYGDVYDRSVIHDGVKVAKAIEIADEFKNMGAAILKEAARKTVDEVGDGTTLTIVLAYSIFAEALKLVNSGHNPMRLRKDLEGAVEKVVKYLATRSEPIEGLDKIKYIAKVSAQDEELGELVGSVLFDMGPDGVVSIETSKSSRTYSEKQTGMQLSVGYQSPYFVTDPEKMEAVLENAYVLATDLEINSLLDLGDLLKQIAADHGKLLLISPSFGGDAIPSLVENKLRGILPSIAIKAPSFGANQKAILEDIALLTGGRFISEDSGGRLKDIILEDLGRCQFVTSTQKTTLIGEGQGNKQALKLRKAQIKKQLETEEGEFEREKLKERLGKLDNGISVIYCGGLTEIEMKERKERLDDAVQATRAAMRGGIIPGGEIVLLEARQLLDQTNPAESILYSSLAKPFEKLIANSGQEPGEVRVYLEKMQLETGNNNYGYDVMTESYKDMLASGIIDPALVPQNALKNALSVAIQLLTTDCIIVPDPKNLESRKG